jgi:hypothetical protein
MGLDYGKLILGMTCNELANGYTVLTKLIQAYLAAKDVPKTPPGSPTSSLWSPVAPNNEWLCKRLLRLLEKQDLKTFITTLNTNHLFPEHSEACKILSAFFSFFPEHLADLSPIIKKNLTIDFGWISSYFKQLTAHYQRQANNDESSDERMAACFALQSMTHATCAEQIDHTIYIMLSVATNPEEHLPSRLIAYETLAIAATKTKVNFMKNFIIDQMLYAIENDHTAIFDAALLTIIASAAQTVTSEKKAEVLKGLLPYLHNSNHEIRKAAIRAVDSIEPKYVTSEMREWLALASRRLRLAPVVTGAQTMKTDMSTHAVSQSGEKKENAENAENAADFIQQIVSIRENSLAKAGPLPLDIIMKITECHELQQAKQLVILQEVFSILPSTIESPIQKQARF